MMVFVVHCNADVLAGEQLLQRLPERCDARVDHEVVTRWLAPNIRLIVPVLPSMSTSRGCTTTASAMAGW